MMKQTCVLCHEERLGYYIENRFICFKCVGIALFNDRDFKGNRDAVQAHLKFNNPEMYQYKIAVDNELNKRRIAGDNVDNIHKVAYTGMRIIKEPVECDLCKNNMVCLNDDDYIKSCGLDVCPDCARYVSRFLSCVMQDETRIAELMKEIFREKL